MVEMSRTKWITRFLEWINGRDSDLSRYYELEGICQIERTPPVIVQNLFGGASLTTMQRQYCLRR